MKRILFLLMIIIVIFAFSCSDPKPAGNASLVISAALNDDATSAIQGSSGSVTLFDVVVYKGENTEPEYASNKFELGKSVTVKGLVTEVEYTIRVNGYTSAAATNAMVYGEEKVTLTAGVNTVAITLEKIPENTTSTVSLNISLPSSLDGLIVTYSCTLADGGTITNGSGSKKVGETGSGILIINDLLIPAGSHVLEITITPPSDSSLDTLTTAEAIRVYPSEIETINLDMITETPDVYGVMWNYSDSGYSTKLTRLDPSNDPNKIATATVTTEPVAYNSGDHRTDYGSLFDTIAPWSEMKLCAVPYPANGTNGIIYYDGNPENYAAWINTYTTGDNQYKYDIMVYLPEMYYRVIDDSASDLRYYYVSAEEFEGSELHPGSNTYVSRYYMTNKYADEDHQSMFYHADPNDGDDNYEKVIPMSVPNGIAKDGLNYMYHLYPAAIDSVIARKNSESENIKVNNGEYYLFDYFTLSYIQLMYLVEYADWTSRVGYGTGYLYASSSNPDSIPYHSGTTRNSFTHPDTLDYDEYSHNENAQYRYISSIWERKYEYFYGLKLFEDRYLYISNDRNYENDSNWFKSLNYESDIYLKSILKTYYDSENQWCIGLPEEYGSNSQSNIGADFSLVNGNSKQYMTLSGYYNISIFSLNGDPEYIHDYGAGITYIVGRFIYVPK